MLYSFSASLVVQAGGATIVVMERLLEVREEGHCNVVGGPTGSGTCATALRISELVSSRGDILTRCALGNSHFLHSRAGSCFSPLKSA